MLWLILILKGQGVKQIRDECCKMLMFPMEKKMDATLLNMNHTLFLISLLI